MNIFLEPDTTYIDGAASDGCLFIFHPNATVEKGIAVLKAQEYRGPFPELTNFYGISALPSFTGKVHLLWTLAKWIFRGKLDARPETN